MAKDTIPPPNPWDIGRAFQWLELAERDPQQFIDTVAQHVAECRHLRNLTHPRRTEDNE